jgi:hypothetical protein
MSKAERQETVDNVVIVSRHGIENELLRMRRAVEGLPEHLRSDIAELFADSKHGVFNVELRSADNVDAIASRLSRLRSTYIGFDYRGQRVHETSYP